jgi:hypothetical protein
MLVLIEEFEFLLILRKYSLQVRPILPQEFEAQLGKVSLFRFNVFPFLLLWICSGFLDYEFNQDPDSDTDFLFLMMKI